MLHPRSFALYVLPTTLAPPEMCPPHTSTLPSAKAKISIPAKPHNSKILNDSKTERAKMLRRILWRWPWLPKSLAQQPRGHLPSYVWAFGSPSHYSSILGATCPYTARWLCQGWSLPSGAGKFSPVTTKSISSSWKSAQTTRGRQPALCPCHMYTFACSSAM